MSKYIGMQAALDEVEKAYTNQLSSMDAIKSTTRSILSSASLIVSLISTLQLFTSKVAPEWLIWYRAGVGLIAFLYIILILLCIIVLVPTNMFGPVSLNWKVLVETFDKKKEKDVIDMRVSALINAIDLNRPNVRRASRLTLVTCIILPIIVITLILLAMIPRV